MNEIKINSPESILEEIRPKVNLKELYGDILSYIRYYLDISEPTAVLLANWILATHYHSQFPSFPILYLNAMKGSGKTRALRLIAHLGKGCHGFVESSISESALFHSKDRLLALDEMEPSRQERSDICLLLNSAYKKGSTVTRMTKVTKENRESYEEDKHNLYKPVCIANINGLDSVLEDRSLIMILEKSFNKTITRRIEDFDTRLASLKTKLNQINDTSDRNDRNDSMSELILGWNDYIDSLESGVSSVSLVSLPSSCHEIYKKIHEANITGRTLELCFPLLIIASKVSVEVFDKLLDVLKGMAKIRREGDLEDIHVLLYRFISIQESNKPSKVAQLFESFKSFCSVVPSSMNASAFSKALNRLNLILSKQRTADSRTVILDIDKAKQRVGLFDAEAKT